MNNLKYKLSPDLIESLPEGAQLYADPEDAFDALVTKVAKLEKEVATLRENTSTTIDSIETVSVLETEVEASTDNVFHLERPVDANVSSKYLRGVWGVTSDTIKQLSGKGCFRRTGRGLYDRRSIEQWLSGPINTLVNSKKAADHYGVAVSTVNSLAHRNKVRAVDFGLRNQSNFRFDLSHEYSK
jgi:hypothetical protein